MMVSLNKITYRTNKLAHSQLFYFLSIIIHCLIYLLYLSIIYLSIKHPLQYFLNAAVHQFLCVLINFYTSLTSSLDYSVLANNCQLTQPTHICMSDYSFSRLSCLLSQTGQGLLWGNATWLGAVVSPYKLQTNQRMTKKDEVWSIMG